MLGVVFVEILRQCHDQSVVRRMTKTKNSQLYKYISLMNSGLWPSWKMVADLGTFGGFMLEFTMFIH